MQPTPLALLTNEKRPRTPSLTFPHSEIADFTQAKALMNSEVAQILEHKRVIMQEKGAQPKRCACMRRNGCVLCCTAPRLASSAASGISSERPSEANLAASDLSVRDLSRQPERTRPSSL